jgi:UDP-glucose 4-epimerase
VNTQGTIQVLNACAESGVSRLIYASTALIYGPPIVTPVTEDHPTAPRSLLAASKRAAEVALQASAERLGVRCDIARLSEVYGASFDERSAIGAALLNGGSGRPVATPPATRVADYLHVDDAAAALIALACSDGDGAACRVVNVASGAATRVADVLSLLARIATEYGLDRMTLTEQALVRWASEADIVLDIALIQRTTGWSPRLSLEEGLRRTVESWLRLNQRVLS